MKERALLIGGHLKISSRRGHGTRVQLTIGPSREELPVTDTTLDELGELPVFDLRPRRSADTSPQSAPGSRLAGVAG
jgi:hypothetical protein